MNHRLWGGTIAALACATLAGGMAAAGEHVWVSADGERHDLAHGNAIFLAEDGDSFDVAELADGETRTFGSGEKQVVATREGDRVTIRRAATADDAEMSVVCLIGSDTCRIMSLAGDPAKIAIMVRKERECVSGDDDCDLDLDVDVLSAGDGAQKIIVKTIECGDSSDCAHVEAIVDSAEAHAEHEVTVRQLGLSEGGKQGLFITEGGDVHVLTVSPDTVTLRCPEGDTTMRVSKEEADEVFLCPKHALSLEKQEPRTIRIKTKDVRRDEVH